MIIRIGFWGPLYYSNMKEPPKQYIGSCLEVLNPEPQTSKHVILTNLHFSIGIIMKASILGGCVVGSRMIASAIFLGSHMRFVQCIKFSLELWFTIRMIHIYISLSLSPSPSLPLSLSLSRSLSSKPLLKTIKASVGFTDYTCTVDG